MDGTILVFLANVYVMLMSMPGLALNHAIARPD